MSKFKTGDRVTIRHDWLPGVATEGVVIGPREKLPGEYIVKSDEFGMIGMFHEDTLTLVAPTGSVAGGAK